LVVVVEVLGLGGGWVFMAAKKLLARKYKPSRCTFPLGICAPLTDDCGGRIFGDIWKSFLKIGGGWSKNRRVAP